ncbi:MAG: NADH:flavin oxidoreductase/NADH oxidase [Fimbriimonadaceae bacterium]
MALFDPITFRGITLPNRIAVSPMCMYSSVDGAPNEWHFVHLGSRAVGGSGLVMTEASAVVPEGRISPDDAGMYSDAHVDAWAPVAKFIKEHGSVPAIQLAHAGRKASMSSPWKGSKLVSPTEGGWSPVFGPSAIPFSDEYPLPTPLDGAGIQRVVTAFRIAAERSLAAGFEVVEIHGAHGYLLHSFASTRSNTRVDAYGGSFVNRTRLYREVAVAVREVWPERLPLFVRISASDWTDGAWDIEQSIELAKALKDLGVDLIDCSSGGNVAGAQIPAGPNYQVPFAQAIRAAAGIATGAVGFITDPKQADEIVGSGKADLVLLARANLRNPYWPHLAAKELGVEVKAPVQYIRAW